jgi:molybdopterin molybdotransferase
VGDDPEAIASALRDAAVDADAVVTTGGVSVGHFDHVKEVMGSVGAGVDFWKVRMKPGKPLAFGRLGGVPLFGLPGNPVSCLVNFAEFVRPWLRASMGDPAPFLPLVDAVAGEDFHDRPGRARFLRVRLAWVDGGLVARSTGTQSSGAVVSMALADGLLVVPHDQPAPLAGASVRVQLLHDRFLHRPDAGTGV